MEVRTYGYEQTEWGHNSVSDWVETIDWLPNKDTEFMAANFMKMIGRQQFALKLPTCRRKVFSNAVA